MATASENKVSSTEQLLTQLKENVKQFIIIDNVKRPIAIYTAATHVAQGGKCHLTRYGYLNATSTIITSRLEQDSIWDPENTGNWESYESLPSPLDNSGVP